MSCPRPSAIRCPPRWLSPTVASSNEAAPRGLQMFVLLISSSTPPIAPLQPDPWKGSATKGAGITRKKTFKEVAK